VPSMGWGIVKYRWADDQNKVIHVTETLNAVGTITAHVNLEDDVVEIMKADLIEPANTVTSDDHTRILKGAKDWARRQKPLYRQDIRWHEDGMKFDTHRESWEWASSVVYNEIGNIYEGYRTEDEKIACSLVYELTRLNTFQGPIFHVFAHNEYNKTDQKHWYMVWVERV
jgi:hypothetical protein